MHIQYNLVLSSFHPFYLTKFIKKFNGYVSTLKNNKSSLQLVTISKSGVQLPTKISKFTVLRSPHIDKKSREQFELRVHKKLIRFATINKLDISKSSNKSDFIFYKALRNTVFAGLGLTLKKNTHILL